MEQRKEFVNLAIKPGANISELAQRYKISRRVAYKWIKRYKTNGIEALADQSRRPLSSPGRISDKLECRIIDLRKENPQWGAKKIRQLLINEGNKKTIEAIPAVSTVNSVLKRNGFVSEEKSVKSKAFKRFEQVSPNLLWQMDFKGYFALDDDSLCHPLTLLDDYSRFSLCLEACRDQKRITVEQALIKVFLTYGIPDAILCDNGSPWGTTGQLNEDGERAYSKLEVWLMRQGIITKHGRPNHPQTQGKEERFHRTLKTELLQYEHFKNHEHCQQRFNWFRDKYNLIRPHEALDMQTPISRYEPSKRIYKPIKNSIEYDTMDIKRKVLDKGFISFQSNLYRVGKAFIGEYVAIKHTLQDGKYEIYFCNQHIKTINLNL